MTHRKNLRLFLLERVELFVKSVSLLLAIPDVGEAITTQSTSMPWEGPLSSLSQSITGPVASALSLIMVVVGVGVLFFGGDLQGWSRWAAFAAIALGTVGGASRFVMALGVTGALVL